MSKDNQCENCGALRKRQLVMFLGNDKRPLFDDVITKEQRRRLYLFIEQELNCLILDRKDNPLLKEPSTEQKWQKIGNTLARILEDESLPENLRYKLGESIGDVINEFSSGAHVVEATRHDFVQACQHAMAKAAAGEGGE
jgi:hypothetical protein